jgi:hypothetical protein
MSDEEFSLTIKDHVAKSRSANMHPAKLLVLSSLLQQLLARALKTTLHRKLASLSEKSHSIISSTVFTKKGTSGRRVEAKEAVAHKVKEIDKLVSKLLK